MRGAPRNDRRPGRLLRDDDHAVARPAQDRSDLSPSVSQRSHPPHLSQSSLPSAIEPPSTRALYTRDERARRDASRWTLVQGVLAPLQFLIFAISLGLVLRYLATGDGHAAASVSVV